MTGPLAPPASAAVFRRQGELPLCERSAVALQAVPRQDGGDLGVEDPGGRPGRAADRLASGGRLRDRAVALPDLDPREVRRAAARRQPDRPRIDDDPPGPQPLPRPGRAADVVVHDLPAVQGDAEGLRVVVLPDVEEDRVRPRRDGGEPHVGLAVPAARPDHPRALRVGRRDQRDRLVLEGLVARLQVLRVAPFPLVPVDDDRRPVEVDAAEELGAGRLGRGLSARREHRETCTITGMVRVMRRGLGMVDFLARGLTPCWYTSKIRRILSWSQLEHKPPVPGP